MTREYITGRRVCVRRRVPIYLFHITGRSVSLALTALSISRLAPSACKLFIADAGAVIPSLAADTSVWKIVLRFESYHYAVFAQVPYAVSRIICDTTSFGFSTLGGGCSSRVTVSDPQNMIRGAQKGVPRALVIPNRCRYDRAYGARIHFAI